MKAVGYLWKIFTMQIIDPNMNDAIYGSDVSMHLLLHLKKMR